MKLEDLPVRAFYCLKSANICTIEDLCKTSKDDIIKIRNLGRKSLEEILEFMKINNLNFKE